MLIEIKEKQYLANMDYGYGDTGSWLEVIKRVDKKGQEEILFCRNKAGVHAWHCNSLPISDSRIIEVKET